MKSADLCPQLAVLEAIWPGFIAWGPQCVPLVFEGEVAPANLARWVLDLAPIPFQLGPISSAKTLQAFAALEDPGGLFAGVLAMQGAAEHMYQWESWTWDLPVALKGNRDMILVPVNLGQGGETLSVEGPLETLAHVAVEGIALGIHGYFETIRKERLTAPGGAA